MKNLLYLLPLLLLLACGDDDGIDLTEQGLTQGLVAHIPFDGTAANLASGVSGTLHGGVEFTAGRNNNIGSAILLDGIDDFAEFPHDPAFNFGKSQEFTLSVWIKPDEQVAINSSDNDIISKWCAPGSDCDGYPFTLRMYNSSNPDRTEYSLYAAKFTGSCRVSGRLDSPDPISREYHHVIFLKKSTQISLYVDGVLIERTGDLTEDVVDCDTKNTSPMLVGVRHGPGANIINWFKGAVDELRIYNRSLTDDEIQWLSEH